MRLRERERPIAARGGTASVEFAMILPVLALLLFGAIDIGRLLADYHLVSKSVRDATRYLARLDADALGLTCGVLDQGSTGALQAKNLALTGRIDGDPAKEPLLSYWRDPATIQIAAGCIDNSELALRGTYAGFSAIPSVEVTALVPFRFLNGWALSRDAALTVAVRHKMAHVGR